MKAIHFYNRFSAFVLFFFMSFLPFFFLGIDAEYNLNQQIDRGYISRNAIFFAPDLGSSTGSQAIFLEENEGIEITASREQNEAENRSLGLPENEYCENRLTCIENILSSGGSDYFAAVHTGKGRYVYYDGKVMLPPILEGRFLSPEECLSREPMAVIGKNYESQIFIENGTEYIYLDGLKCEVIGIAGIAHDSTIDGLYFINLGSVPPDQQIGRFFVDGTRNMSSVFGRMNQTSSELMRISMRRLDIPMTYTDAVTGNVYMKDYLKWIVASLLVFIYLSILSQALSAERLKIGTMKMVGISTGNVSMRVHWPLIAWGASGIVLTLVVGLVLLFTHYFYLPQYDVVWLLLVCGVISAFFLMIWLALFLLFDCRIDLREVTQQL